MNITAYSMAHQNPGAIGSNPGVSKKLYDDLMKPKEHAKYRKKDPFAQTMGAHEKISDGMPDLGDLERHNRMKYGVKKPANVWRHEMDDSRISGFQFRTTNYKTSMFDRDLAHRIQAANINNLL